MTKPKEGLCKKKKYSEEEMAIKFTEIANYAEVKHGRFPNFANRFCTTCSNWHVYKSRAKKV